MSDRAREWYDRFAPLLVLGIGIVAAIGILIGALATVVNVQQNAEAKAESEQRDSQQKALLDCFDDFASQLAGGLPPVREASAARDDALATALKSLQNGLVEAQRGSIEAADLDAIIESFAAYQDQSRNLSDVRDANPYPPPPSTFCSTR